MKIEQMARYERNMLVDGIGEEGQERLLQSKVLIIGAGGLGSPAAMYLAAAGVGTIGIADADIVEISNLQRQLLHSTNKIGKPKVWSAEETINQLNPDVKTEIWHLYVSEENIDELISNYDMIVDACDNFETKFLINDACVKAGKPFVHGGVLAMHGQLMTYVPGKGPCFRCIFQEIPEKGTVDTSKEIGILGAAAGVIGSLQAMEVIKYLLGMEDLLTQTILTCDFKTMKFRKVPLPERVENCPVCNP